MSADPLSAAAAVVAYQDVTLTELRNLFDQLEFDLRDVLERETRVSEALDGVDSELDAVRARIAALGIAVPDLAARSDEVALAVADQPASSPRYAVPLVPAEGDFDRLVTLAEARLGQLGIDLTRDPLLQLLPSSEIARSLRAYADEHGDVTWGQTDWAVVIGAGLVATLLDIVLVGIPQDVVFHSEKYTGSPLTKWLQEKHRAGDIHARFFKKFEAVAKVPYDASIPSAADGLVSGLRPAIHRLQSLGHDPVVGFLAGVADIMHGTGTYIDKAGKLVQVTTQADSVDLITAVITEARHLLSDVYTPAGIQPPLFSLLQIGQIGSPFALGPSGVRVPWTDVARYMYEHGYDLRHFFTMGLTPGLVSAIIRGYWLLNSYATGGTAADRKRDHAKLASMLLVGHTVATSGTLIKTGLVFGMNPAALNYNQILAVAPATMAWIKESTTRDSRITQALDKEWESLLTESTRG